MILLPLILEINSMISGKVRSRIALIFAAVIMEESKNP